MLIWFIRTSDTFTAVQSKDPSINILSIISTLLTTERPAKERGVPRREVPYAVAILRESRHAAESPRSPPLYAESAAPSIRTVVGGDDEGGSEGYSRKDISRRSPGEERRASARGAARARGERAGRARRAAAGAALASAAPRPARTTSTLTTPTSPLGHHLGLGWVRRRDSENVGRFIIQLNENDDDDDDESDEEDQTESEHESDMEIEL
ncbi:unnamed protein product [Arctia plantaginis]|uniref:Uncharacterized protein n=1 Tax=Arctia plantaginis TaxID=874455 RepID=A0A8S0ZL10_ARCPL|nr:unnamed protein product [Arctia plantaginis]